jgi:uncharacterized membrane protein YsdA (DUF1294 family)
MSPQILVILCYLIAINAVTFIFFGIDKWKAVHGKWRISEAMLLGLAVLGGSIGAWLGMMAWRHKTKHKKFQLGVPVIMIMQIVLFVYICS